LFFFFSFSLSSSSSRSTVPFSLLAPNTILHSRWSPASASVFFPHYTEVLLYLIFSSLTWSPLFSCSFHSSRWNLFWNSLVLHAFNMTTPF
jgi:hypothetical protein